MVYESYSFGRGSPATTVEGGMKLDFERVFELAPGGMAIFGSDGRPVVFNQAMVGMLECRHPGAYTRSLEDLMHPEEVAECRERMRRLLSGERDSFLFEGRFVRETGRDFRGVAELTLLRVDTGGSGDSHFVLNLRDNTKKLDAERKLRESAERFRALVDRSSEIVKIVGLEGNIRYASPAMERVLGYPPDEITGRNIFDFLHPDDIPAIREKTEAAVARAAADDTVWNVAEYRMRHADGSWRHIESVGTYLPDHPAVRGVVINARDISERRENERRIRESEEKYRRVVETIEEVIFRTDGRGRWSFLNPAWTKLTGYSPEESIGRKAADFLVRAPGSRVSGPDGDDPPSREVEIETRRGTKRIFEVSFAVEPEGEDFHDSFGILHDVTERKRLEERLERLAMHDPLTDLPNRRLFLDYLRNSTPWGERGYTARESTSLLFLDIDRFKQVNDNLGHEAGDSVLVAVAGRLEGCVRAEDIVARLGGEEFVILMAGAGVREARRAAERVLGVFGRPFSLGADEAQVNLGVSIGIACAASREISPEELLRRADTAMYQVKRRGGGGWSTYNLKAPENESG
ncbi:bifunctional diguanylate cyclase/phosphodiesterase [Rubrobacter indicoceani]|uniref:sensor domain-containing protein n=1 Tax=Rubrobacter indicoceani TaxID=2051957 RepID=UPI0013C4ABF6|nr:PAS domain S-box protein [Rubrobacter indicoceani]